MGLGLGGRADRFSGSGGSGESRPFVPDEDEKVLAAGLLGGVGKMLAMLLAKLWPKPMVAVPTVGGDVDVVVVGGVDVVVVVVLVVEGAVVLGGGNGGSGFDRGDGGGSVLELVGVGLSKAGGGAGSAFEKRDRPAAAAPPALGVWKFDDVANILTGYPFPRPFIRCIRVCAGGTDSIHTAGNSVPSHVYAVSTRVHGDDPAEWWREKKREQGPLLPAEYERVTRPTCNGGMPQDRRMHLTSQRLARDTHHAAAPAAYIGTSRLVQCL